MPRRDRNSMGCGGRRRRARDRRGGRTAEEAPMTEQMEQRLEELKAEFEAGRALLADLESRQTRIGSSLLRISGAICVLEELLGGIEQRESAQSVLSAMGP